jgi:hypothetical protein
VCGGYGGVGEVFGVVVILAPIFSVKKVVTNFL